MDFNGPGTLALVRNPMIRYTLPLGPATLTLAAENARGAQFGGAKFQTVPDFHANLGFSGPWGTALAARRDPVLRQTFTDAAGTLDRDPASKLGFAGAVSGSLKLAGDTLVWQVSGGPGIGRYFLNALGTGASGAGAVHGRRSRRHAAVDRLRRAPRLHARLVSARRSNLVGAGTWITTRTSTASLLAAKCRSSCCRAS